MLKGNRSAWIGAGVGLALGMPMFEVFLLTVLAIDGGVLGADRTVQYFSKSANVITLLIILHLVMAALGALVGYTIQRMKKRRRFRVIPGRAH